MGESEELTPEKFTFTDALDAATEWVFNYTRLGWVFLVGIFLVIAKLMHWVGMGDTQWINVLWPFIFVAVTILIVSLVFRLKYDVKIVVENELEGKEYNEMVYKGKSWVGSDMRKVILNMRWIKKKK